MRASIAILLAALLGGCASAPAASGGSLAPSDTQTLAQERQQAQDALDRYAAAVAAAGGQQRWSVTEGRTGQIGDWEPANGGNKLALVSGRVEAAVDLPSVAPPPGEVRWDSGSTLEVPLVSAAQALTEMRTTNGGCGDCTDITPLRVTGARLSSGKVGTSRGPATVPIWEFTVEGTAVRITQVAVAPAQTVTVSPPSWDPENPPVGLSVESATGSATSGELTVAFIGAPEPASQPCGADYTAEAVESPLAVVVIVVEHRYQPMPGGPASASPVPDACRLIGAARTATVQLAAPLGDRAVLEVREGLPVPVTLR